MWTLVLCLFLTVPWVGLQYFIVAFPGHTYFFMEAIEYVLNIKTIQSAEPIKLKPIQGLLRMRAQRFT